MDRLVLAIVYSRDGKVVDAPGKTAPHSHRSSNSKGLISMSRQGKLPHHDEHGRASNASRPRTALLVSAPYRLAAFLAEVLACLPEELGASCQVRMPTILATRCLGFLERKVLRRCRMTIASSASSPPNKSGSEALLDWLASPGPGCNAS
jgi:hypothetical protein